MLIFLISLPSCQKNSFTSSHDLNSEFSGGLKDDPFQVVLSETPIILNSIDKKTTNGSLESRSPEIIIKSTAQMNDDHGKAAIYMVNYAADGLERFAILSGDKREVPVLAYGPNFQNFYDMPAGPKEWSQDRLKKIKDIRKVNKPEQEEDVKAAWANLALLPFGVLPPPPPPSGCGDWITYTVGPLTYTIWDQYCNLFNYFVIGKATCTQQCYSNPSVGCVAVAIGQIIKKYNFGHLTGKTTYDFINMPYNIGSTSPYRNSKMLFEIAEDCYTHYYCYVGGSTAAAALETFHHLGYSSACKVLWNGSDAVRNQIAMSRPVFCSGNLDIYGAGHAWMIDGYTTYSNNCSVICWYRCNWGWGGILNGYFKFGEFNPGGENYNFGNDIIINIYPQ